MAGATLRRLRQKNKEFKTEVILTRHRKLALSVILPGSLRSDLKPRKPEGAKGLPLSKHGTISRLLSLKWFICEHFRIWREGSKGKPETLHSLTETLVKASFNDNGLTSGHAIHQPKYYNKTRSFQAGA